MTDTTTSTVTALLDGVTPGPRPAFYTCKGCPAHDEKYWREPSGDGETWDSGTINTCAAANKRTIDGAYGSGNPRVPDWCPFPSTDAERDAAIARAEAAEAEVKKWETAEPSDQRKKYGAIAAQISIGKASQDDAVRAIMALCRDNERLAVMAGKHRARVAELEAALPRAWERGRDAAWAKALSVPAGQRVLKSIAALTPPDDLAKGGEG